MILANRVLMVRPAAFGFSEEAAGSNTFQTRLDLSAEEVQARALAEFERAVTKLRRAGIEVEVVDDTAQPPKPDAIFPNNWFSTHPDGAVVLYPMAVPSRRAERRPALVTARPGVTRVVDLAPLETDDAFLEGTGSLVLDHDRRIAFACASPRTTPEGLHAFALAMDYRTVVFTARLDDTDVYHTNVVLSLGPEAAIVAVDLIESGREELLAALAPRRIVGLDAGQVRRYAGNALTLLGKDGPVTVMSSTGWSSLSASQRARIGESVLLDIPTIETVGGGSARCMLAELFF